MFWLSANCSTICEEPSEEVALIVSMPEIVSNCLISGVATAVAMVCGEAPGNWAETEMVGKLTSGSAATGSSR